MTTFSLELPDKSTVILPAELAHQAGLEEGEVQVILGEHSLTMVPITPATDYTFRWEAMAAQFDLSLEDRRDASYWDVVSPLFEEAERMVSSI